MKKLAIFILVIIIIFGLISGFILLNSKPDEMSQAQKEKALAQMLGRKANTNPEIKTGSGIYSGKFVEFSYPAAAEEYKYRAENTKDNKSILETFSFDLKMPRLILNFTVIDTPASKFDDVPSLRFRENTSSGYTKSDAKADGVAGVSYKKDKDGEFLAEKSTFFLKDGKSYTFSVTGSSLIEVEKLSDQIINSIVFK